MFATTPNGYSKQALPVFSSKVPLATALGALFPGKGCLASPASTRSASPGCSSSSSEEVVGAALQEQSVDHGDCSKLACRRGRSVLMLNELVMDLEVLPCKGGSSDGSPSSLETDSGYAARCTPFTQQMMSFSPMPHSTPMITPSANQVAEHSMMRTTPMMRSMDASQRSPPCARGLALGLGAAAAGGDASNRNPIAKISLGIAVIGGDASQRSPPGCVDLSQIRPVPSPMQQNYAGSSTVDLGMPSSPMPNPSNGTITGTSPASHGSPTKHDASQRSPAGWVPTKPTFENCNDAIKAWLVGVNGNASLVSAVDLVEQLYAAAPEIYED